MLLISAPTSSGISISLDFIWVTCNPSHLNRYSDALKAPSEWPVMWYCGKDNGVGFSSRCELAQSLPALSMDQVLTSLGCILLICEIKVWTDMSEASTTSKILVSWIDLISVGQSLLLHLSKWRELRDFNTSPKVCSTVSKLYFWFLDYQSSRLFSFCLSWRCLFKRQGFTQRCKLFRDCICQSPLVLRERNSTQTNSSQKGIYWVTNWKVLGLVWLHTEMALGVQTMLLHLSSPPPSSLLRVSFTFSKDLELFT
jgi:hypothetical protein